MPVRITAQFDSPDEADLARMRLRGSGVDVGGMRVEALRGPREPDGYPTAGDIGVIINPYDPGYSNSIDESWSSLAGANTGRYGGFLWSFSDAPLDTVMRGGTSQPYAAGFAPAGRGTEVRVTIDVPERYAGDAESILVSCHARRVGRRTV